MRQILPCLKNVNPVKDKIISKIDFEILSHLKNTINYITIMNMNMNITA